MRSFDFANLNEDNPLSIYSPYYPVPQPESPETAIARQDPSIASDLLRDISRMVLYRNLAESGGGIAGVYLHCLKDVNAPSLRESSQLGVEVKRKINAGFGRMLFGEEDRGFSITIGLR